MNRVVNANLNGNAYLLEENGYEALRTYLDGAARRLDINPDRDEIMADIEQAVADKFNGLLGPRKTVILTREVETVIAEMGPVEDAGGEGAPPGSPDGPGGPGPAPPPLRATGPEVIPPKRLYRLPTGAMIAGVCNGIAAYLNVDVTIVRLGFVLVTACTVGFGLLAYLVLAIVVPPATTPAEREAASGIRSTSGDFIRRAREGYYAGLRTLQDRSARRAWKRRFHREMRQAAAQWKSRWREGWAEPCGWPHGAVFAPLASLPLVGLALLWIAAMISVLANHTILGFPVPAGIPVWVTILLLIVIYRLVAWPFRLARHASYWYWGRGAHPPPPLVPISEGFLWLAFWIVLIWFANRHIHEVHAALRNIAPTVHHAVDSVRRWWTGR
ncbi:MAG: PspC domain-containing protein [Opitutaceae bacterium]